MSVLVVRSTFRLHDNAVLTRALADKALRAVIVPIDAARVLAPATCLPTLRPYSAIVQPRFVLGQTAHRHAWGYHQYAFLLLAVRSFVHDLRAHLVSRGRVDVMVHVCKASVATLVKLISSYATVYMDRVDDPAWTVFDAAMAQTAKRRGATLCHVTTQTLLDWYDDNECVTYLKTWRNTWRISASNQAFKDYVVGRLRGTKGSCPAIDLSTCRPDGARTRTTHAESPSPSPSPSPRPRKPRKRTHRGRVSARTSSPAKLTRRRPRSALARLSGGRRQRVTAEEGLSSLDLDREWARWSSAMRKARLRPYDIVTEGLERYALRHLDATVAALSDPKWEKRLTNVSLGIRDHATAPTKDTSKLSPYLALGVLSPRWAYVRWWGATDAAQRANEGVPSSAIAQLLWRETFHAASRLPLWWTPRRKTLTRKDRFWRHEPDGDAPYGGWRVWRSDDADPLYQGWLTATTGAPDLDESLMLLVVDGWVHHLRRHLIADYLTRGRVKADWMLGEQWFRQTLVDHDACINRGNWMWLSASDFSTAQMRRHYGYKNYVQRHVYKDPCHPLPPTKTARGAAAARKTPTKKTHATTTLTFPSATSHAKGVYGGHPDPRKRYAGHYKVPAAPTPPAATVHRRKARRPTRDAGTQRFHFADHPEFDPDCAPQEVLAMGAFGGTYFRDIWSGVRGEALRGEDALQALPRAWWKGLNTETQLCSAVYRKGVNHFKATCGGSLDMWESSGWINPIDPYGWFQWYCHFFDGRRTTDDERQIARWHTFTNPNSRFVKPLVRKCVEAGKALDDASVSPVTRQNLLHWGRLRLTQPAAS